MRRTLSFPFGPLRGVEVGERPVNTERDAADMSTCSMVEPLRSGRSETFLTAR
jgi:hypothetical protein